MSNSKIDIKSMNLAELTEFVASIGEKAFRAKQIYQWLHVKQVASFDEMTNLPKALLEQYGIFEDSRENLDCLLPEAVVAREETRYGGVRALVRRDLAPAGFRMEKPSVEDIILFLVKGAKNR